MEYQYRKEGSSERFVLAEAVVENLEAILPTVVVPQEKEIWQERAAEACMWWGRDTMQELEEKIRQVDAARISGTKISSEEFDRLVYLADFLYLKTASYNQRLLDNFKEEVVRLTSKVFELLIALKKKEKGKVAVYQGYYQALIMDVPDVINRLRQYLSRDERWSLRAQARETRELIRQGVAVKVLTRTGV